MKRYRTPTLLAILCLVLCLCSGCGGKNKTIEIKSVTLGEISEYRPIFTTEHPPEYGVLNSITDNATIGDERQFVRVYDSAGTEYVDTVELQPYQIYEVRLYLINDNSKSDNKVIDTYGHANLPETVSERGTITADIFCDATYPIPEKISGSITVTSSKDLNLVYIRDSAQQYVIVSNNKCAYVPIDDVNGFFTDKSRIGTGGKNDNKWYIYGTSDDLQYVTFAFFAEPTDTTSGPNPETNTQPATKTPPVD